MSFRKIRNFIGGKTKSDEAAKSSSKLVKAETDNVIPTQSKGSSLIQILSLNKIKSKSKTPVKRIDKNPKRSTQKKRNEKNSKKSVSMSPNKKIIPLDDSISTQTDHLLLSSKTLTESNEKNKENERYKLLSSSSSKETVRELDKKVMNDETIRKNAQISGPKSAAKSPHTLSSDPFRIAGHSDFPQKDKQLKRIDSRKDVGRYNEKVGHEFICDPGIKQTGVVYLDSSSSNEDPTSNAKDIRNPHSILVKTEIDNKDEIVDPTYDNAISSNYEEKNMKLNKEYGFLFENKCFSENCEDDHSANMTIAVNIHEEDTTSNSENSTPQIESIVDSEINKCMNADENSRSLLQDVDNPCTMDTNSESVGHLNSPIEENDKSTAFFNPINSEGNERESHALDHHMEHEEQIECSVIVETNRNSLGKDFHLNNNLTDETKMIISSREEKVCTMNHSMNLECSICGVNYSHDDDVPYLVAEDEIFNSIVEIDRAIEGHFTAEFEGNSSGNETESDNSNNRTDFCINDNDNLNENTEIDTDDEISTHSTSENAQSKLQVKSSSSLNDIIAITTDVDEINLDSCCSAQRKVDEEEMTKELEIELIDDGKYSEIVNVYPSTFSDEHQEDELILGADYGKCNSCKLFPNEMMPDHIGTKECQKCSQLVPKSEESSHGDDLSKTSIKGNSNSECLIDESAFLNSTSNSTKDTWSECLSKLCSCSGDSSFKILNKHSDHTTGEISDEENMHFPTDKTVDNVNSTNRDVDTENCDRISRDSSINTSSSNLKQEEVKLSVSASLSCVASLSSIPTLNKQIIKSEIPSQTPKPNIQSSNVPTEENMSSNSFCKPSGIEDYKHVKRTPECATHLDNMLLESESDDPNVIKCNMECRVSLKEVEEFTESITKVSKAMREKMGTDPTDMIDEQDWKMKAVLCFTKSYEEHGESKSASEICEISKHFDLAEQDGDAKEERILDVNSEIMLNDEDSSKTQGYIVQTKDHCDAESRDSQVEQIIHDQHCSLVSLIAHQEALFLRDDESANNINYLSDDSYGYEKNENHVSSSGKHRNHENIEYFNSSLIEPESNAFAATNSYSNNLINNSSQDLMQWDLSFFSTDVDSEQKDDQFSFSFDSVLQPEYSERKNALAVKLSNIENKNEDCHKFHDLSIEGTQYDIKEIVEKNTGIFSDDESNRKLMRNPKVAAKGNDMTSSTSTILQLKSNVTEKLERLNEMRASRQSRDNKMTNRQKIKETLVAGKFQMLKINLDQDLKLTEKRGLSKSKNK